MMATLDVMRRASSAGANMVITHEPTFYSHPDTIDQIKDDPIYKFKLDIIEKNKRVSFHFHDHWHGYRPDGIGCGRYGATALCAATQTYPRPELLLTRI